MLRIVPLAIACAFAAPAIADELVPPHDASSVSRAAHAQAQRHFAKAQKLFKVKKYEDALKEIHDADDLDPQPAYLFAIAQVHVKLNHCADAITYFERYLATHPGNTAALVSQTAIDTCKAKLPPPPPPPKPEPPPPPPLAPKEEPSAPKADRTVDHWYSNKLNDTLLATGVVSGVAGLLLYRAALGDLDVANQSTNVADHALHVQHAETMRTYALIAGGAGAALVSLGMWRVTHRHEIHAEPVAGGAVVSVTGKL